MFSNAAKKRLREVQQDAAQRRLADAATADEALLLERRAKWPSPLPVACPICGHNTLTSKQGGQKGNVYLACQYRCSYKGSADSPKCKGRPTMRIDADDFENGRFGNAYYRTKAAPP